MKDTVLTARRKRTELITLLICFVVANLVNLYSILTYNTPLSEIITSIFYVLIFSVALYICWSVLRILFYGAKVLFVRKKRT